MGMSARVSVSQWGWWSCMGPVKEANWTGEKTVQVAGGFGPDGPQPPARG